MKLELKDINKDNENFIQINDLYHRAFPKDERAPMHFLIKKVNENKGEFLGIYDENKWIGLVYIITYQKLSYVFYLAIDEKYRGHGYGSQVLQLIKKRYSHTIMLCIEEVDKKYDNYKQRVKRKQFYLKNGLKEMDFYFIEAGVRYEMLFYGKKLSSSYYDQLMINYIGERYKEIRVFE